MNCVKLIHNPAGLSNSKHVYSLHQPFAMIPNPHLLHKDAISTNNTIKFNINHNIINFDIFQK